MDHNLVNNNLRELLLSENGCQYTDLTDDVIDVKYICDNISINVLHLNIRSFNKNVDNLILLLNDLQEKGIVIHVIGICESFLGGLSLHLNHLIASRMTNYYWPFETFSLGIFWSNLDTMDLETYPRTYFGHF